MCDYFITYNSHDRAWAEWIAWRLEQDNFKVHIQAWDFSSPKSLEAQLRAGVEDAQCAVITLLSPNYFTDEYTVDRWEQAFTGNNTGKKRTIIRLEECAVPESLQQCHLLNSAGLAHDKAYWELMVDNNARATDEAEAWLRKNTVEPIYPPDITNSATHPAKGDVKTASHLDTPSEEQWRNLLGTRPSIIVVRGDKSRAMETLLPILRGELRENDAILSLDLDTFGGGAFQDKSAFSSTLISALRRQRIQFILASTAWDTEAGDIYNFHHFVRDHVITMGTHTYLVINSVERLVSSKSEFAGEFFSLLRSWHTARSTDTPSNTDKGTPWRYLTLILITPAHSGDFSTESESSPFNVGTWVTL